MGFSAAYRVSAQTPPCRMTNLFGYRTGFLTCAASLEFWPRASKQRDQFNKTLSITFRTGIPPTTMITQPDCQVTAQLVDRCINLGVQCRDRRIKLGVQCLDVFSRTSISLRTSTISSLVLRFSVIPSAKVVSRDAACSSKKTGRVQSLSGFEGIEGKGHGRFPKLGLIFKAVAFRRSFKPTCIARSTFIVFAASLMLIGSTKARTITPSEPTNSAHWLESSKSSSLNRSVRS